MSLPVVYLGGVASVHLRPINMRNKTKICLTINHTQKLVRLWVLRSVHEKLTLRYFKTLELRNPIVKLWFFHVLLQLYRYVTCQIPHHYSNYCLRHFHQKFTLVLHSLNWAFVECESFLQGQFRRVVNVDWNKTVANNLTQIVGASFRIVPSAKCWPSFS